MMVMTASRQRSIVAADNPAQGANAMKSNSRNADDSGRLDRSATAAYSTNAFGLDLYRALADQSPDENLFMSPYSMSVALTMTAEGARGETFAEMAGVLHFSKGDATDRRSISIVHEGYADLRRRFRAIAGNADARTRKRIESLTALLEKTNREAEELQRQQKWRESQGVADAAATIADELNELRTQVDRFELRSANALWVEKQFDLVSDYVKTIDRYYDAGGITPMDFVHAPEPSRIRINEWVEENTAHRIKDLIPARGITPDTRLVITNAIYFLGQWSEPFDKSDTKIEDFTLQGGEKRKVHLMQDRWRKGVPYAAFNGDGSYFDTPLKVPADESARPRTYPDDAGFTMIELPYKGDELAMVVIAPRSHDGLAAIEKRLDAESLDVWLSKLTLRKAHVAMPRFKLEADFQMGETLQSMGMKRAFVSPAQPDGADFGGMSESTDPSKQLYIGAVIHKAFVEVTEEGTEAAAATAVMMLAGAAAPSVEMIPFIPEFRADRPFLFLIRDTKTGVVLFVGRMMRPNA